MARTSGSSGPATELRIRQAAVPLIARHGYEAMTLRQLAKVVGLLPASIYRYYPSKQVLLATLLVEHMETLLAEWQAEAPHTEDPLVELEAFCVFHVKVHIERQQDVFIGNMELRSLEADNLEQVVALRKRYEMILSDILARGTEAGVFVIPDVQVASYALLALLTGVCNWYREGGRLDKAEIIRTYTQMALRMVRVDQPVGATGQPGTVTQEAEY